MENEEKKREYHLQLSKKKQSINNKKLENVHSSLWSEKFLSKEESKNLFKMIKNKKFPLRDDLKVNTPGGKKTMPRRVGFFSNVSTGYKFSGQKTKAQVLTPELEKFLKSINEYLKTEFNGILINHYRNGNDSISAHSDDESELSNGVVAMISLGSSRIFRICDQDSLKRIVDMKTKNGNLTVMDGKFQKYFRHCVPKATKAQQRDNLNEFERVSLTFRVHNEDVKDSSSSNSSNSSNSSSSSSSSSSRSSSSSKKKQNKKKINAIKSQHSKKKVKSKNSSSSSSTSES